MTRPSSWSIAEAKARFSEVIEKALREGAQEVTRHGQRTAAVVSAAKWDRRTARKVGLVDLLDLLDNSPLKGSGRTIERPRELPATPSCEVPARPQLVSEWVTGRDPSGGSWRGRWPRIRSASI
jgi:prevent-host-death family protein